MGDLTQMAAVERRQIAEAWLEQLNAALARGDWRGAAEAMGEDAYWRDLLTFGWAFRTCHGIEAIADGLARHYAGSGSRGFHLDSDPTVGRLGAFGETIEFFIAFETSVATGRGYVRLILDPNAPERFRVLAMLTAMKELKAFPELHRMERRRELPPVPERGLQNWQDEREAARAFRDRDPEVVIVGAGMAGIMTAARLQQLDIPTLIVDRMDRVGDVWRKRYHSLTLHNEVCTNHFPYLPFPDTWPVYIPKDKLANWMEFYADAMELNVWNRTNFLGGTYDADKRWTVRVERADGGVRTLRPAHVILAVGVSGLPSMPRFPGQDSFRGPIVHSSGDIDALDVNGRAVLVVGTGTSGHDVAQDLYLRGANVTMLQRSSTTVVSLEPSSIRVHELYKRNEGLRPIGEIDMMAHAIPFDLTKRLHVALSHSMQEDDRALLDGLRKIGFLLDNGEDDTGYFMKLLRYQSGYYLDIGCSQLLIDGKIKLKSGVGIERLGAHEAIFTDGTALETDILVLATGYEPLQERVRAMFGDEVADRVGPIYGIGDDGELRNMFSRTAQDGFYFVGGGFMGCRAYTHYTARLIKARIEGLA